MSEASSQALIGDDFSLTTAALICLTFVGWEIAFTWIKTHSRQAEKILEGVPTVVFRDGKPLQTMLKKCQIDELDVLRAARAQGLTDLSQVEYAILEANGKISIIKNDEN